MDGPNAFWKYSSAFLSRPNKFDEKLLWSFSQYTHVKWKVSIDYYSGCVLSNLGDFNNLTEARNVFISKYERGFF